MADGVEGASAAAAARRRQLREEEELTIYSAKDLNNCEFTIVRAVTGIFGKPAEFNKLIQEEARAGWELVEKFDNKRIRFKRPISARVHDSQLPPDIDPYRTQYGMSLLRFTLLLLAMILVGFCGFWSLIIVLFNLRPPYF